MSRPPLSDHEIGWLAQAPSRERQPVLGRPRLGDLPDFYALRRVKVGFRLLLVLRVERVGSVGVEVMDHSRPRSLLVNVTWAIWPVVMPWVDSSTICARRQVTPSQCCAARCAAVGSLRHHRSREREPAQPRTESETITPIGGTLIGVSPRNRANPR
jgi:hypothetical protein